MRTWLRGDGRLVVVGVLALLVGGCNPGHAAKAGPVDLGLGATPTATAPSVPDTPAATAPAGPSPVAADPVVIAYRVEVRSPDPTLADAPAIIREALEDPRGWQQAGFDFRQAPGEVQDAPYAIVLDEGPAVQELCLPYDVGGQFSCQNGPVVALNAIRWRESVAHWPGDLHSYRQMLVNHEVGHLLGMHHLRCRTPGAPAPLMEQQSGTLRGCLANPWPTPVEIALASTHQFVLAPAPLDVPFPQ